MVERAGKLIGRIVVCHQHFIQAPQAHDIFADGAVVHLGLFKQILFKRHDVEVAGVTITGDFTTKPA
ncbi:hypothetical protein D3C75_1092390 [compost metagenome]